MKVILKEDVKGLGKKGEVAEVSEGYARNFLIPKGLVMEASKGNLTSLAHQKALEETKKQRELEQAKAVGEKLKTATIKIAMKAGEGGRLFGSVTNKEISEQISKQIGLDVDKRKIELKEPIKNVGAFQVTVKLHPKVQVELRIEVSVL